MKIEIDYREIIPLEEFELGWRFEKLQSSDAYAKAEIKCLSANESRRLNKVIDYFEIESNRVEKYLQTGWFTANQESDEKIELVRNRMYDYLKSFDEDVLISRNRTTLVKTTKKMFIDFWTDFFIQVQIM